MTYVLKTCAITGYLVPARGEHIEYTDLRQACKDASILAHVQGESVFVYAFETDQFMAKFYPGALAREAP